MSGPAFWLCLSGWLTALAVVAWHHRDRLTARLTADPTLPSSRRCSARPSTTVRIISSDDGDGRVAS